MSERKIESEYESKIKNYMRNILEIVEKEEYIQAVDLISDLVGDGSLENLKTKIRGNEHILILQEINQNRRKFYSDGDNGEFSFNKEVVLEESLTITEKFWKDILLGNEHLNGFPVFDLENFLSIIKRNHDIERQKIAELYFFGEFFGAEFDVSSEQLTREGVGLAIEHDSFFLSWKYEKNQPSEDHRFIGCLDKVICYLDSERNLFSLWYQPNRTKKSEEGIKEGGLLEKWKVEKLETKESFRRAMETVRYNGPKFVEFSNLDRCYHDSELFPLHLLSFYKYFPPKKVKKDGYNLHIIDFFVRTQAKSKLFKIFSKMPELICCRVHTGSGYRIGFHNLIFSVLEDSVDEEFMYFFFEGCGVEEAKIYLHENLKDMHKFFPTSDYRQDNKTIPLVHEIFYRKSFILTPKMITKSIIVNNSHFKENSISEEDFLEKRKKELEIREIKNAEMKKIFLTLGNHLDWNAKELEPIKYGNHIIETNLIESVIKHDNLEIAEFLINGIHSPHWKKEYSLDNIKNPLVDYLNINDMKFNSSEENETLKFVKRMRTFFIWDPSKFNFFSREFQYVVILFIWILREKGFYLPIEMINEVFAFVGIFGFDYILGEKKEIEGIISDVYLWQDPLPDFKNINMKMYYHEIYKIKEIGRTCFIDLRGELEFKGIVEYCLLKRRDVFLHIKTTLITLPEKENKNTYKKMEHHHQLIHFVHDLKNEIFYRYINQLSKNWLEQMVSDFVKIGEKQFVVQRKIIQERIENRRSSHSIFWFFPKKQINWLSSDPEKSVKYYSIPSEELEEGRKGLHECMMSFLIQISKLM